jgi:hypothetical protein
MALRRDRESSVLRRATGLVLAAVCAGCGVEPSPDTAGPRRPVPAKPTEASPQATDTVQPREITFDDIKLEMQKGDPFTRDLLPERVTELERRRVRIRGYILPSFQQHGLTQFVLVRDNQECCFGPGAALHDCVVVRMRAGRTADFSIRPVAVAGTFKIEELRGPDGKHLAIYALDGDRVE